MRLIDADEIGLTDFEIVMCSGDYKEALKMLIDKISNQPTAYDIDKVVEELEERKEEREKQYKRAIMEDGSYMLSKCFSEGARAYGKAIEIAQAGCVSDDCCEWEPHRNNYVTSCEEDFVPMMRGYKYCPYCGKKIKIVGD